MRLRPKRAVLWFSGCRSLRLRRTRFEIGSDLGVHVDGKCHQFAVKLRLSLLFSISVFPFHFKTQIFHHFPSFTDLLLWLLQHLVCYKMCHNVCYYKTLTYINMVKCFAQRSRCKRATSQRSCSFLLVYLAFFFPCICSTDNPNLYNRCRTVGPNDPEHRRQ